MSDNTTPPTATANPPTEAAAERASLDRKTRRAFQVLILQRGRNPGVKGWEMRRYLGKDYKKILDVLSDDLKPLGLEVHQVPGAEGTDDSTRFLLRFRDPPTLSEAETAGFRIDDLAVLAATIALVNSKQGRISRKELESFPQGEVPPLEDRLLGRQIHQARIPRHGRQGARPHRLEDEGRDRRAVADDADTRARDEDGSQEVGITGD